VDDILYHESDASKHPKASTEILRDIDAEMKASGYSVIGDFATSENPDHTIRCYISEDRTVIAIKYISALCRRRLPLLLQTRGRLARSLVGCVHSRGEEGGLLCRLPSEPAALGAPMPPCWLGARSWRKNVERQLRLPPISLRPLTCGKSRDETGGSEVAGDVTSIRPCRPDEHPTILAIVNAAAEAYPRSHPRRLLARAVHVAR
jgi:hypothetical protein